jgi:hypothetical protein
MFDGNNFRSDRGDEFSVSGYPYVTADDTKNGSIDK